MLHVALWEPEIPPNTGNVARLCAAARTALHLIGRLGFRLDDRSLRRAGLDYWDDTAVTHHTDLIQFQQNVSNDGPFSGRIICFSAHAEKLYTRIDYADGDCLLFGNESRGLPQSFMNRQSELTVTIPMPGGAVRCLNLANSVSIGLYEALRQLNAW